MHACSVCRYMWMCLEGVMSLWLLTSVGESPRWQQLMPAMREPVAGASTRCDVASQTQPFLMRQIEVWGLQHLSTGDWDP